MTSSEKSKTYLEKHRLISEIEKARIKGQTLHFLTGDGIKTSDNFCYDLYYGVKSLDECLKIYYLKEQKTPEYGGFGYDYFIHVVNSATAEYQCFKRDEESPQGYVKLDKFSDLLSPTKVESVFEGFQEDKEPESTKNEDEQKAQEQMEEAADSPVQRLNRLSEAITNKDNNKRYLILLEGMEWIANLYDTADTTWISNLQKPEWRKAHNLLVVVTIKDFELLKKYQFAEKETIIGNPTAEEIKLAYLRYIVRNMDENYKFDFKDLNDVANTMNVGGKSLIQCMRVLKTVLHENPSEMKLDDFRRCAELNIEEEVKWSDVILDAAVKERIAKTVDDFLDNDNTEQKSKGFILTGPPGTGKTMIAKALANEKHCTFLAPTLADMKGEYVGQSSGKVRRLFDEAIAKQPTILFIDEADTVLPERGMQGGDSYSDDMVNEFLQHLDGAKSGKYKIFTIAATNRYRMLDSAIRSRLGSNPIEIPLPNKDHRLLLLNHMLTPFTLDGKSFQEEVLERTANMSGRDLKNFADRIKKESRNKLEQLANDEFTLAIFRKVLRETENATFMDFMKDGVFTAENIIAPEKNPSRLEDIIGYDSHKREIQKQIDFMLADAEEKNKYGNFGIKPGKGVVLYGPPGNGKSELAQAIAGENGFYFFKVLSQDFASNSASDQLHKLEKIFGEVQRFSKIMSAPGIVLFFDEFDSLVGKNVLSTVVRGTLLNFLADKDGLRSNDSKILLVAATNFFDNLDDAVKRKGRIDAHLMMDNPTKDDAIKMLQAFFHKDSKVEDLNAEIAEIIYQAKLMEIHQDEEIETNIYFSPSFAILRAKGMSEKDALNKIKSTIRPSGADLSNIYKALKEEAFLKKNIRDGKVYITLELVFDYFRNVKIPNND